jgi:para-nitrobenzyl esterase
MQEYFANFIKKADPNGPGLPQWPAVRGVDNAQVMRIDVDSRAEPDKTRPRYLFLDQP